MGYNTSKCRACGADIMFIKTIAGKTTPVDAQSLYFVPEADGKAMYVLPDGSTARGRTVPDQRVDAKIGYISHFATCPQADKFRKARKSDRKKG